MIPPTTIPESLLVNAYIVPLFWQLLILAQSAYPIIPPTPTIALSALLVEETFIFPVFWQLLISTGELE